ncbi:MAG: ATP-binding cassette domain-containing protein [Aquiluna sp.]|nr:ATP-binding cassette domain-containing protein [Aquiluna sp.]
MALGFVLLRVIYSMVFGTAAYGSDVLFEIPQLRLSGPFSHITLFGSVTISGIVSSINLALPFALVILVFALASSWVNPARLIGFAKKLRFGANLVSALAIALVQLPGFLEAAKRVSFAMRLRGEKRSRYVVPIFEIAIARANSIALRLFLESTPKSRALPKLADFLPVGASHKPVNVELKAGELLVLKGKTGTGKTGTLEALAGIIKEFRGREFLGEIPAPMQVGYLPQNPRDLLFGFVVSDELGKTENLPFGLSRKLDLPISTLSEGEAVQVWLAKILSQQHLVYLLDEPFASLDKTAQAELGTIIQVLLAAGKAVVIAEHQFSAIPAGYLELDLDSSSSKDAKSISGQIFEAIPESFEASEEIIFETKAITAAKTTLIQDVKLQLQPGTATAILGKNGAGKTSLLRAISKSQKPDQVSMIPEVVEDFFVCQSLREELERADQIAKVTQGFTQKTLESFIPECGPLLDLHPRDLSAGQKLALGCAMQLSHKPKLLLIDEPVKGFDSELRETAQEILHCVLETGTAIAFATHDREFANSLASTHFEIRDQMLCLVEVAK